MGEEPLIYTNIGNVPESSLVYTTTLEDHMTADVTLGIVDGKITPTFAKKAGHMVFTETWTDKLTGELRKQSPHVFQFGTPETVSNIGNVGG